MSIELDEDGFYLDEWGQSYGYCNACGEEAPADSECCEDGEVVPPDPITATLADPVSPALAHPAPLSGSPYIHDTGSRHCGDTMPCPSANKECACGETVKNEQKEAGE